MEPVPDDDCFPPPDPPARSRSASASLPESPPAVEHNDSEGSLFSDDDFPPLVQSPSPVASPVAPAAPPPAHSMTTRAKDSIRKPNPRYALLTDKASYSVPKTVKQALQDEGWTNAMGTEMDNHRVAHTWDLVPPPENIEPLGCG